jgi:hypothetical protein
MSRPVILVGCWPRRMGAELAAYGEPAGDSPVGLSTPAPAAVADPHGCELLHSIRELARSEVDWLEPACRAHFNGTERVPADAPAVTRVSILRATVILIDEILADAEAARRYADLLSHPSGRA